MPSNTPTTPSLFFRPAPGWLDIEGRQFGRLRAALSAGERHAAAVTRDAAAAPGVLPPAPVAASTPSSAPPASPATSTRSAPIPVVPPGPSEGAGPPDAQADVHASDARPVPGGAVRGTTVEKAQRGGSPSPGSVPSAKVAEAAAPPAAASPKDVAVAQTEPPAESMQAPHRADNAKVQSIPNPAHEAVVDERPAPTSKQAASRSGAEDRAPPAAPTALKAESARTPTAIPTAPVPSVDTLGAAPRPGPEPEPAIPPALTTPPDPDGRPPALTTPRDGRPDDLKLIKGIGPKTEATCNALGIHHIDQIAAWSPAHVVWVGEHLTFSGRIERERWVDQAKALALGFDTPHAAAVKSGETIADDAPLSEAEVSALRAAIPAFAASVEGESRHAGRRPVGLATARGDAPDDLQRIRGIGKQNETRLQALGIWHFVQIARWTPDNVQWVGSYLAFPGRITREDWIAQASALAAGGTVAPTKPAVAKPVVAKPAVANPGDIKSAVIKSADIKPAVVTPDLAGPEVAKSATRRRRP